MYGLIGRMTAVPGEREALIALMIGHGAVMQGCLSYLVARDRSDADVLWITEVWDSEASHKASLAIPEVRGAIMQARPLIAAFDSPVQTEVAGGVGLGGPAVTTAAG